MEIDEPVTQPKRKRQKLNPEVISEKQLEEKRAIDMLFGPRENLFSPIKDEGKKEDSRKQTPKSS